MYQRVATDEGELQLEPPQTNSDDATERVADPPVALTTVCRERKPAVSPGATLGPYRVLDVLGEGGMGVVFRAEDGRLARRVALKVLRSTSVDGDATALLRREARALAALSHPNVVQVFGVEQGQGWLCIAMECVAGIDLGRWLSAARRSPELVLDVFRQAGEGLAAAHAIGIVHRDFKPANVLLGTDGRVRVVDFGIACMRTSEDLMSHSSPSHPGLTVTTVSSVMSDLVAGTPKYMAPEQHAGHETDARADQYAFCLALSEALTGELPFDDGGSPLSKATGPSPRLLRRLPRWMRATIERGLAPAPEQRFTSMSELLRRLEERQRGPYPWLLASVAAAAGLIWAESEKQTCSAGADRISEVWDDGHSKALARSLAGLDRADGSEHFSRLERSLTHHAAQWRAMFMDICEGNQRVTTPNYDQQMLCLQRTKTALQAQIESFTQRPGTQVADALAAATHLPDASACADLRSLSIEASDEPAPPPHLRAAVDAVRIQIERVRALRRTARPDEALLEAQALVERAERVEYPPLHNFARWELAKAQADLLQVEDTVRTLERLYFDAKQAQQSGLAVDAALDLAYWVGYRSEQYAEGERWLAHARSEMVSRPEDLRRKARLLSLEGALLYGQEQFGRAAETYEKALSLSERDAPGSEQSRVLLTNLGNAWRKLGRTKEAVSLQQKLLQDEISRLGPNHPRLATLYTNLASAHAASGASDAAEGPFRRSLELQAAAVGENHWSLAVAYANLGSSLLRQDKVEEAEQVLAKAAALVPEALARGQGLTVAFVWGSVAELRIAQERYAEAEHVLHSAIAALPANGRTDTRITLYRSLADAKWSMGDFADAARWYARAADEVETAGSPDKLLLANLHWDVAESLMRNGDQQQRARARLDASIDLLATMPGGEAYLVIPLGLRAYLLRAQSPEAARADLDLALQLCESSARGGNADTALDFADLLVHHDRALAVAVVKDALELLRAGMSENSGPQVTSLQAWLAEHDTNNRRAAER